MILYLDTSALVKKYWSEEGSMEVLSWWREAEEVATSSVAYAEALPAFYRKRRETDVLSEKTFGNLLLALKKDWRSLIRVHVTDAMNQIIEDLIKVYPLRGLDLIHLASALLLSEKTPEHLVFACYDDRLKEAARASGLKVLPQ